MERLRAKSISACVFILLLCTAQIASGIITPSNDDCTKARPVGDVTDLEFNTAQATFDGPGHYMISPNIWYCYTATCTGGATVSLAGSSFDTKLAVYNGCVCDPAFGNLIKSNDDFHAQQSQVTFAVTAGNRYLIEVGGYNVTSKGPGVISIGCDTQACQPANDNCSKAEPVGNVKEQPFDTSCATFDGQGHCMSSPNIWYRYIASGTGQVTISLAGSTFDTMLAVYDGTDCPPSQADTVECNDDFGNSLASQIAFQAIAGREYLIEIGGYNTDEIGVGLLSISSDVIEPPAGSNDECVDAKPVGDVKNLPFDTRDATFDGPGLCLASPNIWFCYTAPCTGPATISLFGSGFDTMLAVYNGCKCYPTYADLIGCNDDAGSGYQSELIFNAVAGKQYLIEIGGYGSATGLGILNVNCRGPISADKTDLGDAPDSTNNFGKTMTAYVWPTSVQANYPTVFDDGSNLGPHGPVHLNDQPVAFLGRQITRENEADIGPDEETANNIVPASNGRDHDAGDDGVAFPVNLPNCGLSAIDYEVTVVEPGIDLWVNVWLDFNRDGDWDDVVYCPDGSAPEWAVQNQYLFDLPAGLNQITTPGFLSAHPVGVHEQIWMRITLAEQPWMGGSNPGEPGNAGSGPQAKYEIGETEDYFFSPETVPDSGCPLCEDVDGNGVIDIEDLVAHVTKWLATCP
ncbi:MAG: GEVED domain-containing protein [Planctomycetota bacterium]|jgi:hypothetical protein